MFQLRVKEGGSQKGLSIRPASEVGWEGFSFGWRYLLWWGVSCGLAGDRLVAPLQNASRESPEAPEQSPGSHRSRGTCGWTGGMGACLYHLLESGPGGTGPRRRFPANPRLVGWGRTCGRQTLLRLLGPRRPRPFWGNVGRLRPIRRLRSRLPGHRRRSLSYSVALWRRHRRRRRGCQSLLLPRAQFPLRSRSRLAESSACCPQNRSYRRQICRDLGRRRARRGASRKTRTRQTCRKGGREEGW